MPLVKVRFQKTAANARYSANPGDEREVTAEEAKDLVADNAAVIVEKAAPAVADEPAEVADHPETAQAPAAPENAAGKPTRRGRR